MAEGFLDIIGQTLGEGGYDGDQFGGADGQDGTGLPEGGAGEFMFATGIECSNPTINQGRLRRDLLEECGHYTHWKTDLALVKALGLKFLRYGLPYHRTHLGPGRYDFAFVDEVMAEIQRLGITPILDLMHFGVPDWLGNFQNPELPIHFAAYAEEVAKRYPWVRFYTPVNEIYVSARNSGKDGIWNEQLKTDHGFVTALKHLAAASILATQAIVRHRPNAVIVQSESEEYFHEAKADRSREVGLMNKQRFLSLDLLYAHQPDADAFTYLADNGLTRAEYNWFMRGEPPGFQVMGCDYYGRNEHIMLPDGGMLPAEDVLGWYHLTREYYDRYKKPVMHTETNVFDAEAAKSWIWKQWINCLRLREDGVPVLGFTWYSLTDQIDWDTQLAEKNGHVNACGLYDLNRNPRPLADCYRCLLQEFGRIPLLAHAEMMVLGNKPARLKTDI